MTITPGQTTLCVLGLGYIGLPTASILATRGFLVHGVDVDPVVLRTLGQGRLHISEPGLMTMLQGALGSERLVLHDAPVPADVFVIAVSTPRCKDGSMDPRQLEAATHSLLPHLCPGNLVILESTVSPGTSRDRIIPILEKSGLRVGEDLFYAHCPERVLPGKILYEFIHNHRIVGANDETSRRLARELYGSVVEGCIEETSTICAELSKLYENTFRDVNIALANEAARICERLGADVHDVIRLANLHPRVTLHQPGPGVGGHCISVDPYFLITATGGMARLVATARAINEAQPAHVVSRVLELIEGHEDPKVTILGVAYKGNVDDVRETPATAIIEGLEEKGIRTSIYDPHVKSYQRECEGLEASFEGTDCVLVLTEHDEFKYLDPKALRPLVRHPAVYDTRSILGADTWRAAGFDLHRLGAG